MIARSGIPEYVPEKPWGRASWWQRRRCRRGGGHFGPVERMVDYATISMAEWCCSECRTIVAAPAQLREENDRIRDIYRTKAWKELEAQRDTLLAAGKKLLDRCFYESGGEQGFLTENGVPMQMSLTKQYAVADFRTAISEVEGEK